MKPKLLATFVGSLLAAMTFPTLAQEPQANLGIPVDLREEVRNSFIFVFKDAVPASAVAQQAFELASRGGGRVTQVYTHALQGFAAKMPDEAAARVVAQNPRIAYFEPDMIAFAFARPPANGGGTVSCGGTQVTPWGIVRVGGPVAPVDMTKTAWVIDTGIDFEHPDLNVDTTRSASFLLRGKTTADDGNGHGTHVAGTIAAVNNTCGVVGVAPGATLVAVRVLDNSGSGSYSGVIKGVDYVAAKGKSGDVANMSLGGPRSQALNDAVEGAAGKGIFFSLAAGNESSDASNYSPASASGANIYTVSAIDSADRFASFSNFGAPVDCAAPGVSVLSTRNGGGTTTFSGTSMAAPHVAGLLLFGLPNMSGTVIGDKDSSPDRICVH